MIVDLGGHHYYLSRSEESADSIRVLVLERSEEAARLLRDVRSQPKLTVHVATNARNALRLLAARFYDAVVVNLPLTRTRPEELYRVIGRVDRKQADRLIFLITDFGDAETQRFLIDGRRPYLTRPVDASELHDLVVWVSGWASEHAVPPNATHESPPQIFREKT